MAATTNYPPVSRYYVVARVPGSENSFPSWYERLIHLCAVSATEPRGTSYHWARSLSPDKVERESLWGLEGYTDAAGFFDGHPASDVFKEQMQIVDDQKLLRADYDLHHYWSEGGFLRREGEGTGEGGPEKGKSDGADGIISVVHFYIKGGKEKGGQAEVIKAFDQLAEQAKADRDIRSFLVLREVEGPKGWDGLVTLWIRTPTQATFTKLQSSSPYKDIVAELKAKGLIEKEAVHQSEWFNGHIDKKPLVEQ
ncbi:MAG: hypothetical protein M1819_002119 [Sarea resinae]|nr:MAG: hypothetical protein M1819_002119 [Sarea resinae]